MRKTLDEYVEKKMARFHMPGHKGKLPHPLSEAAAYDITEIEGADSLYEASGVIAQMEAEFAALYGSAGSFLSAGGSTLCVQAMLALAAGPGDRVICGRNAHASAVNAMALLDIQPEWVYPNSGDGGLMAEVKPDAVEAAIRDFPDAAAVYITSPGYYGVQCDIGAISGICHSRGIPLLVDNAHGAHLKFFPRSLHPMDLGADICTDSLHKTLPALTGGALLHVGNPIYLGDAKRKMALFGSTSPSYLIMLSCGMLLDYLRSGVREDISRVGEGLRRLRHLALELGYSMPPAMGPPIHFTLNFRDAGYSREEYGAYIRAMGVEPEYIGESHCVFLASPLTSGEDLDALERVVRELKPRKPLVSEMNPFPRPRRIMGLREAAFASSEMAELDKAVGRAASGIAAPCPPGIPVVMPGEEIDGNMVNLLKRYGFSRINVVR